MIRSILDGLINGFMFWVVIIVLIILGCVIYHFIGTIALVFLIFFCIFWFRLFILASSKERLALIIATAIFMSFISQNPENLPLWLGGTIVIGFAWIKRED